MRRLLCAGLLVSAVSLGAAQDFRVMPPELQARWRCSLERQAGWNDRGFDASAWQTPRFGLPGRYPEWMEPALQALYDFIWHPDGAHTGQPVFFRRTVWLSGQVTAAEVNACADDQFMLYANGLGVMQGKDAHENVSGDLAPCLRPGENVIAVQAQDVQPPAYGLLVAPTITQSFPMDDGGWQCDSGAGTWVKAAADKMPPIQVEGLDSFACLTLPGGMKEFSTATFRRTLELDGLPLEADAVILGDDSYELRVNGQLVALEKRLERAWQPREVNLMPYLHSGSNTLEVKVTNDWGPGRFYCVPTVTMTF